MNILIDSYFADAFIFWFEVINLTLINKRREHIYFLISHIFNCTLIVHNLNTKKKDILPILLIFH